MFEESIENLGLTIQLEKGELNYVLQTVKEGKILFIFTFAKLDELNDALKRLLTDQILEKAKLDENERAKIFIALTRLLLKAKEGKDEIKPLRDILEFALLNNLYTKVNTPSRPDPLSIQREWTLWEAKIELDYPPIFILDRDGHISPAKRNLALEPLHEDERIEILKNSPSFVLNKVRNALSRFGIKIEGDKDEEEKIENIANASANIFYRAVPRIRDPSFLRDIDFQKLVGDLTSFKVQKDPALQAIHKSHLLRGLEMSINPHSIQATIGGTGKSLFYEMVGIHIGKATPSSFLGFAKSPDEIYFGTVHNSELPINVDQIESQYAVQIVRFLFNVLEFGKDNVSSGAVSFPVKTTSIFNFSANPIGYSKNPAKSFANLLSHFTLNPAIGRRIALILYGKDFKVITTKPSKDDLKEWKEKIALFRATEEYCFETLKQIVHNKKIWAWLNESIEGYENSVRDQIEGLEDYSVGDLLLEHGVGAQARIRASALYCTLAEMLGRIALGDYTIDEIIEESEDKLPTYVEINIKSIQKIAQTWAKEKEALAVSYFNSAPSYIQDILSAIELWRRSKPETNEILLSTIPYVPSHYDHFSKCIDRLRKRKNKDDLIKVFQNYYNIDVVPTDKDFKAILLNTDSCPYIKPIGKLDFSNSPISPFLQPLETPPKSENTPPVSNIGEMEKVEKMEKALFKCSKCGARFISAVDLKEHFDACHSGG